MLQSITCWRLCSNIQLVCAHSQPGLVCPPENALSSWMWLQGTVSVPCCSQCLKEHAGELRKVHPKRQFTAAFQTLPKDRLKSSSCSFSGTVTAFCPCPSPGWRILLFCGLGRSSDVSPPRSLPSSTCCTNALGRSRGLQPGHQVTNVITKGFDTGAQRSFGRIG